MEIRSLREEELESWVDHCVEVFQWADSQAAKDYFSRHFYSDPWRNLSTIFVAVDGDTIASSVRLFHREIYLMGTTVAMGGIGEVSTKQAYRGQGLNTQLLRRALEEMDGRDQAVSWLGTGIHDYYRRLGYEVAPARLRYFRPNRELDQLPGDLTLRPVDMARDADTLATLYRAYNREKNGPVVRDEPLYWRRWMAQEMLGGQLLQTHEGQAVAYVDARLDGDVLDIYEFAAWPGDEPIFDLIASFLAVQVGAAEIRVPAQVNSALVALREVDYTGNMLRLNRPVRGPGGEAATTAELIALLGQQGFLWWRDDSF